MKQVYLYDENNIFTGVDFYENLPRIETYDEQGLPLDSKIDDKVRFTEIRPKDGMYKAQFDEDKQEWIETISEGEIEAMNKTVKLISDTERIDALEGALVELMETLI